MPSLSDIFAYDDGEQTSTSSAMPQQSDAAGESGSLSTEPATTAEPNDESALLGSDDEMTLVDGPDPIA